MDRRAQRRSPTPKPCDFIIPVRPAPRYIPGSLPPLPKTASFLPDSDGTGYVIERIFLPPNRASPLDGKPMPRRMAYVVGFTDEPAARLTVEAPRILDYVSPYAYEQFELNDSFRREEEQKELEKEVQELEEDAPAPLKRKRGRPAKAMATALGNIVAPEPALEHEEYDEACDFDLDEGTKLSQGPSLSTPKKRWRSLRVESQVGTESQDGVLDSDEIEDDEADAIYMQLYGDRGVSSVAGQGSKLIMSGTSGGSSKPEKHNSLSRGLSTSNDEGSSTSPEPPETLDLAKAQPSSAGYVEATAHRTGVTNGTHKYSASVPPAASSKRRRYSNIPDQDAQASPARGKLRKKRKVEIPSPVDNQHPSAAYDDEDTIKAAHGASARTRTFLDPDAAYEVDRLEDFKLIEVGGHSTRLFLVRWEGDWPPDQNPTWEPEENIPAPLVRNFLRERNRSVERASTPNRRQVTTGKPAGKTKQSTLLWSTSRRQGSEPEGIDELAGEAGTAGEAGPHP